MIIWSGFGFLGLLIPIVTAFLMTFLADAVYGKGYVVTHTWPMALGVLIGAGLVYLLSIRLDAPGRILVDPATGQRVLLKSRHTLFWIPLRWIALVVAVIGLVLLFTPAKTGGTTTQTSVPSAASQPFA